MLLLAVVMLRLGARSVSRNIGWGAAREEGKQTQALSLTCHNLKPHLAIIGWFEAWKGCK